MVLLVALAGAAGGDALRAQQVSVTGRIGFGPAGRPLAGAWAVLHQVSSGGDGRPIDSTRTDGRGAYAFTIRHPDSSAIYVVSSGRAGIAYFSEPVPRGAAHAALRPLYVYDTASSGPAVRVLRRLVTVPKMKPDGAHDVLELVELENPDSVTRVASDTVRPTWAGLIPGTAIQFQAGQGDISPQAVARRGDSVAAYGPLPPRERKQLSYTYVLPATVREMRVPIDQETEEVDLLLEDTAAVVTAARLDTLGTEDIEGRRFARYRATTLARGAPLAIAFKERRFTPETVVPWVVGFAGVVLAVAFVVALRRKPR